jgi:hypothetical protein
MTLIYLGFLNCNSQTTNSHDVGEVRSYRSNYMMQIKNKRISKLKGHISAIEPSS